MCVIMISAPPSPTRNYTLFPDATLFRSQFADEFLEEPGDVGLKPAGRLVSESSEEQQHVSVRGHPGGRQNPQRFSHAGAALPDQRSAQRILVQVGLRSDEPTSELQSLMRISYAVFSLKKKNTHLKD